MHDDNGNKEKSNGSALVLYIFVQFIAVLCAWLSSACFQEHERERLSFRIFIWNWMLALNIELEQVKTNRRTDQI